MDVHGAEVPCKGIFSPCTTGAWAEVKFRMFGYVLVPCLKPIPLPWFVNTFIIIVGIPDAYTVIGSSLHSGRYHRHSINLTGPPCSGSFRLCLDGLRLAGDMFRSTISGNGPLYEPIKHLRRGVEIQIIAPKVPAHHAANASAAIACTELVEVSSYLRGCDGTSSIRYVSIRLSYNIARRPYYFISRHQTPWNAVLTGSLIETEIYIRIAPSADQGGYRIRYELCAICIVDDNVWISM